MLKSTHTAAFCLPLAFFAACSGDTGAPAEGLASAESQLVAPEGRARIGDVNGDGAINARDAEVLEHVLRGKHAGSFDRTVADVNRDGAIDRRDRDLIARFAQGRLRVFPVVSVDVLLSQMTLAEKVGQMALVEQQAVFMDRFHAPVEDGGVGWGWLPDREVDLEDVRDYGLGAILTGGDSVPYQVQRMYNGVEPFDVEKVPGYYHDMYAEVQARALETRLMIPVMYGADTAHGFGNVRGATIFPHNIGIGATRDPDLVRRIGSAVAREASDCAVDWVFAPAVSVVDDVRWGRTYEGFSEDTQLVSDLGTAYVDGYQGPHYGKKGKVLATVKHFIGDGGAEFGTGTRTKQNTFGFSGQAWGIYAESWGTPYSTLGNGGFFLDQGDLQCSEEELRSRYLPPYAATIERPAQEVASVMVSHSSWNGIKSHENRHLITEVLKGELGFSGFVVSDWESLAQNDAGYLYNPYHENNVPLLDHNLNEFTDAELRDGINAGIDMLMLPSLWTSWSVVDRVIDGVEVPGVISRIISLVERGEIAESRIDDAVRRILIAKQRAGLFENPIPERPSRTTLGSPEHRELAREAVRKSSVLLKNEGGLLPIRSDVKRLHVAGTKADNLGVQCGGWTISWQGQLGNLTTGTTVLQGIQQSAPETMAVTYTADGSGAEGADLAVVVVGEIPYAEWHGDAGDGYHPWKLYSDDLQTIANVKATGVPIAVVLISGRPIDVHKEVGGWDALLAVWLPGTEGGGVADVLFGRHSPTAKLPFTWPMTQADIPIRSSTAGAGVLYPFGYGLSY